MHSNLGNSFIHLRNAIAWRLHRLLGDRLVYGSLLWVTKCWRRMLTRPVYIGVTGSAGKTTTKELLLGMLSHKGSGVGNYSSFSNIEEIAKALLRLRPWHRFFVTELSGHKRNEMNRPLALLRPSIGIVTVIGNDHTSAAYPREAIANEKCKLIASLPDFGVAVLNADDALVQAMAASCSARILTYGISANAELRAEDISSIWPNRLQMTLLHRSQRVNLHTQLCGTHWVPSVLGAIGCGLAMGMTLEECAAGIASVAPFDGRMQPVMTHDGVTFIRDDWKAPLWTVDATFEFMTTAAAKRKVIVIGELSDAGPEKGKYAKVALRAQEIADVTIFVGPWASNALKARKPGHEDALLVFENVREAAAHINANTREGDLVLLKGTNRQDHLYRIILARSGDVACWRDNCLRYEFCNECPDRNKPSGFTATTLGAPDSGVTLRATSFESGIVESDEQVIVGLGNPEPKYSETPHNIGYAVVDQIAATLGLTWAATPQAWIARGSAEGRDIRLMKIRSAMNGTGAVLKELSESMSFGPAQCILVYDDLAIPLGAARARLSGGAGGHRGVASILVAFQTDAFRRVKVGVGQAGTRLNQLEYVLTAFDAASRLAADESILNAETRVLGMAAQRPKAP